MAESQSTDPVAIYHAHLQDLDKAARCLNRLSHVVGGMAEGFKDGRWKRAAGDVPAVAVEEDWPSWEDITNALQNWRQVLAKVLAAWDAVPPARRIGLAPPSLS